MVRSMYAGVSGLRSHQSKMDVIGNNIANVNTWSFKSYTTNMTDSMYTTSQASTGGQAINGGYGGANPTQLGYGAKVANVSPDLNKGAPAPSSNVLDNMIDGMGYYLTGTLQKDGIKLSDMAKDGGKGVEPGLLYAPSDATNFEFSRVGAFSVDDNGYLVDNQRHYIYGFRANQQPNQPADGEPQKATYRDGTTENGATDKMKYPDDPASGYTHTEKTGLLQALCVPIKPQAQGGDDKEQYKIESYKLNSNGELTGIEKGTGKEIIIGKIALATFENPQGLAKTSGSYWGYSKTGNAGTCYIGKPTPSTGGTLAVGYLEMANTDVAKEFSDMITTERGYQANSKIITVTDEMLETLVNMKR